MEHPKPLIMPISPKLQVLPVANVWLMCGLCVAYVGAQKYLTKKAECMSNAICCFACVLDLARILEE